MKKRIVLSLLLVFTITSIIGQHKINSYKYIIVPDKFEIFNKVDQHQTSSLIKFLFNKNGFKAFLSNETFPEDLAKNKCLALTVVLENNSGFFNTKNKIILKDCKNDVFFTTNEGVSKHKNYKKAYHEAIRNAYKSIRALNYSYKSIQAQLMKNEETEVKVDVETTNLKVNSIKKLYAQSNTNGYQLVDSKPEIRFQILNTNVKDVFILKDINGILYKNNSVWIAEYFKNGKKVIEQFQIKF